MTDTQRSESEEDNDDDDDDSSEHDEGDGESLSAGAHQLPAHLLSLSCAQGPAEDFEKMSCLGEGAFGAVWLARRKADSAYFALKEVLRFRLSSDSDVRHMWEERDALLAISEAGSLKNPALVGSVMSYTTPLSVCLVMDLVEGAPLNEHLRKSATGRFSESTACWYAAEITSAVHWLHDRGWLYRDLKASNVMISARNGRVKLVDFGFAKHSDRATSVVGTLYAMAPEIIRCANLDGAESDTSSGYGRAVDWWSLGVVLFEMLTGEPPFGYCDDVHLEGLDLLKRQSEAASYGLAWPSGSDVLVDAQDAAKAFLCLDESTRLGARSGLDEIRSHAFFKSLDWTSILSAIASGPPFDSSLGDTIERIIERDCPRRPRRAPPAMPIEGQDVFEGF